MEGLVGGRGSSILQEATGITWEESLEKAGEPRAWRRAMRKEGKERETWKLQGMEGMRRNSLEAGPN